MKIKLLSCKVDAKEASVLVSQILFIPFNYPECCVCAVIPEQRVQHIQQAMMFVRLSQCITTIQYGVTMLLLWCLLGLTLRKLELMSVIIPRLLQCDQPQSQNLEEGIHGDCTSMSHDTFLVVWAQIANIQGEYHFLIGSPQSTCIDRYSSFELVVHYANLYPTEFLMKFNSARWPYVE